MIFPTEHTRYTKSIWGVLRVSQAQYKICFSRIGRSFSRGELRCTPCKEGLISCFKIAWTLADFNKYFAGALQKDKGLLLSKAHTSFVSQS